MSDVAAEFRVQTLLPESRSASALSAHPPGRRDVFHAVAVAPSDVEGLLATRQRYFVIFLQKESVSFVVFVTFQNSQTGLRRLKNVVCRLKKRKCRIINLCFFL